MTSTNASLTKRLASFAAETSSADIPPAVFGPAKDLILDTVGVALAASDGAVGRILSSYVAEANGSPATATVLGLGIKVAPEAAALANGTLANALDFDEGSHLSTHVLPAALAVAEHHRLSGRAVLEAFIIGTETGARLTQVIDARRRQQRGPTHRGWWHVGLVGPIAAALTASRLLGLDVETTRRAIGIATCSSGGFRRNMGTMAKALHSGNAARSGLQAAYLAQRGFTADPDILDAPLGFLEAVCLPEDRDMDAVTERLGRPYVLEGTLRLKRFPACNPGHPLIDAALRLAGDRTFSHADIETIEADLHPFSLLRSEPDDAMTAGFSGAFLLAATLVHRVFGLDQLRDEVVRDPRVQNLMKRVRHVPAGARESVTVRLRDHRTITADVLPVRRLPPGAAVRAKFRDCARSALSQQAIAAVEDQIMRLDEQPEVATLMELAGATSGKTA
jgi:2-methylcitrate dehydratase PrpD